MLQVKEYGNQVDFTQGQEIDLQSRLFLNDVFGIYATQGSPVTVDATTRDDLFNGELIDLQAQASSQGMEIQHIRISWNETQTPQGTYYITDFVVGVVAKVVRDFNTGPSYLIDALKAINWFNQIVSKMPISWKSWILLTVTKNEPYKTCQEKFVSDLIFVTAPINEPLPVLPSAESVKNLMLQEGQFDAALGTFIIKMLDEGYVITIFGYRLQVCFEKNATFRSGAYFHTYSYKIHARFAWDFTSTPDFDIVEQPTALLPGIITAAFIFGLLKIVGVIIVASIIAYNLTLTERSYIVWKVLRDAEGNPIFDENGDPIMVPSEEGTEKGPPDWWSDVLTTAVLGGLLIAGLVVVVPPVIKSLRGK